MYLEMKDIKKSFGTGEGRTQVLKGISCGVEKGDICVLLGPSGSGKSTLLNIIGGIETLDSGTLTIDGHVVENMSEKELSMYRRKHLGYVFQSYNLIPNLTVKENIEVGAYLSDSPLPLDELLHTLGLWEHKDKIPNQLSGGQMQRVAIARAIVNNPKLLLADEPTGALDSKSGAQVMELFQRLNDEGVSVLMITHDADIAAHAKRVVTIKDGILQEKR